MLVYRYLSSQEAPVISQRLQWLLLGGLAVAVLVYVAWTLQRTFPDLARMVFSDNALRHLLARLPGRNAS